MWSFSGSVAVFCNDQLIGGLEDLLQWAAQHYNYQDYRCYLHPVCNTACRVCMGKGCLYTEEILTTCLIWRLFPPPGRPPPFYEALAKETYNIHISNPEVSFLIVSSSSDCVYPLYHQPRTHTARLCLLGCLY